MNAHTHNGNRRRHGGPDSRPILGRISCLVAVCLLFCSGAGGTSAPKPTITAVNPLIAYTGDTLTIDGNSFDNSGFYFEVGGITCTTSTYLSSVRGLCVVPSLSSGCSNEFIKAYDVGGFGNSGDRFTCASPLVAVVTPSYAYSGDTVTIDGSYFSSSSATISVSLGGTACTSITWVANNQLQCVVPSLAAGPKNVIATVTSVTGTTVSNLFTYDSPTVSSVTPARAYEGDTITVSGTHFGTSNSHGWSVTVGGSTCTSPTWTSSTTGTCVVPLVAQGVQTIIVQAGGTSGQHTSCFTYNFPTVSSSTPGSTYNLDTITVTGANFGTVSTHSLTISVGGTACSTATWVSSTVATCVVPTVSAGQKTVSVTVDGGTGSANVYTYGQPTITSITPGRTYYGDLVTIQGSDLGTSDTHSIAATVGGTACGTTTYVSATQVLCTVPSGLSAGTQTIAVTVGGSAGTNTAIYTYNAPTVTSCTPNTFYNSDTVTINGHEFGAANSYSIAASVGGTACSSVAYLSATQVKCVLPTMTGGAKSIAVTVGGSTDTTTGIFTYGTPTITAAVPSTSYDHDTITIKGFDFGTSDSHSIAATVGGTACQTTTYVSATEVTCKVPTGLASGALALALTVGGSSSSVATSYTYGSPTITSVVPNKAYNGNTVTISGSDFGTSDIHSIAASVGGVACTSNTWISASALRCVLPSGLSAGAQTVLVTVGGVSSSHTSVFTYNTPTVTAATPTKNYNGDIVTIGGSSFGDSDIHSIAASVGGVACTATSYLSATQVKCVVPSGLAATAHDLLVTVGGSVSAAASNKYTYNTPTVTAATPTKNYNGDTVTIGGSSFGDSDSYSIAASVGGVACTTTSYLSATQVKCVVPSGLAATAHDLLVTVGGSVSAAASNKYTYNAPTVTAALPAKSYTLDTITLSGSAFGDSNIRTVTGMIGGVTCTSTTWLSSSSASCVLPTLVTGVFAYNASITVGGSTGSNAATIFTYGAPTVTAVTPTTAYAGDTVTLSGSYFGASIHSIAGTFNSISCASTTWLSSTTARCKLPALASGAVPAALTVQDATSSSATGLFTSLGYRPPDCANLSGNVTDTTLSVTWTTTITTSASSDQYYTLTIAANSTRVEATNVTISATALSATVYNVTAYTKYFVYLQGHTGSSSAGICQLLIMPTETPLVGCSAGQILCDDLLCYSYSHNCSTTVTCPSDQSICNDGTCAASCPDHDGCAVNLARCYDGRCVADYNDCSTGCSSGQVLCQDGSCKSPASCPSLAIDVKPTPLSTLAFDTAGSPQASRVIITSSTDGSSIGAVDLPAGTITAATGRSIFVNINPVAASKVMANIATGTSILSSAVNITFVDSEGEAATVSGNVPVHFVVSTVTSGSSLKLSFLDETTYKWTDEDTSIEDSSATTGLSNSWSGTAGHFTAYSMTSVSTTTEEDSSTTFEWWAWLLLSLGACCCCCCILIPCCVLFSLFGSVKEGSCLAGIIGLCLAPVLPCLALWVSCMRSVMHARAAIKPLAVQGSRSTIGSPRGSDGSATSRDAVLPFRHPKFDEEYEPEGKPAYGGGLTPRFPNLAKHLRRDTSSNTPTKLPKRRKSTFGDAMGKVTPDGVHSVPSFIAADNYEMDGYAAVGTESPELGRATTRKAPPAPLDLDFSDFEEGGKWERDNDLTVVELSAYDGSSSSKPVRRSAQASPVLFQSISSENISGKLAASQSSTKKSKKPKKTRAGSSVMVSPKASSKGRSPKPALGSAYEPEPGSAHTMADGMVVIDMDPASIIYPSTSSPHPATKKITSAAASRFVDFSDDEDLPEETI